MTSFLCLYPQFVEARVATYKGLMSVNKTLRVRNCYFWIFGFVGIWGALLGPYLNTLKFSGIQIACITAAAPICSVIFPPFWGMLADRLGNATLPLQIGLTIGAIFLLPFPWLKSFTGMLPIYLAFAMFRAGNGALVDSISLSIIEEEGGDFGRSRLFGSIGFLVMGLGAALLADLISDAVIPWALVSLQVLGAISSILVPRVTRPRNTHYLRDMGTLLRSRGFFLFLATGFFAQMASSASMIFYPILYLISIGTVVLRFAPLLVIDQPAVVLGLQSLHALTFGGFYYVSVHFAQACAPETLRSSAQTLFVSVCFGLASGIGILVCGPIFDQYGIDGVVSFTVTAGTIAFLLAIPTAREIRLKLSN
jgi:PPP family 3-phenylpropionic acid transporter